MSVKGLSLQLPGETREPLPQAYCQLCLCHGVSERHGLDALGCILPLRPSLEALHAPEAGTFPQDFQVLLLLALMFLTLHPLSTKYRKWMAPRI